MSVSPSNKSPITPLCPCSQTEISVSRTPASNNLNANLLANSLGVSPLYRQQDSARWQSAAKVYRSSQVSRASSPTSLPKEPFSFPEITTPNTSVISNNTALLSQTLYQKTSSCIASPISLEDIANINRKRHEELGNSRPKLADDEACGTLELEAIAAVHELACSVKHISEQPFTLELTLKGWRIASTHTGSFSIYVTLFLDSMNGDYSNVDLHTKYFGNAIEVLDQISPGHAFQFNDCLKERLKLLEKRKDSEENLG